MIRKSAMVSIVFKLVVCEAHGSGRRSAISRSNRRNVMATRKNFMEKGRRADPIGSNPHSYGLVFSEYAFSWGSQNAMITSRVASVKLVRRASIRFIILFRVRPKLADWKSAVLLDTKRIWASSIDWYIEEKSYYVYKVSISGSGFKAEMVVRGEMEF